MSNTQWTIAVAVMCGFVAGFAFNRPSEDGKSTSTTASQQADGEESDGGASSGASRDSQSSHDDGASRDSRLVGNWRYTETYASDGISMAFDQFMTIEADGKMTVRDGAAAGGGGDFTWEDPASQQSYTCEWRTNGNVIDVCAEGRDWNPLAEYQVSDTNLLTDTNGDRQIWERI